jgi:uncharacterized damage-inducible protein DinB
MKRPDASEYPSSYQKYIDLIKGDNFFELLDNNTKETIKFFNSIDASKHDYRYAKDKWTVKDVLLHMIDTERGFSYRAIMCVRGDEKTPLYPMDENLFAANADTSRRTMRDLLEEFEIVRVGLRKVFEYTTEEQQEKPGNGSTGKISGRAMGYIAIGHAAHHVNVVRERYL